MIKSLLIVVLFQGLSSDNREQHSVDIDVFCARFKQLLVDVREMTLTPEQAREEFKLIAGGLKNVFPKAAPFDSANIKLVFPMQLIDYKRIGGTNGNGYRARGFDLFDHKKKGSHPAHDIFLRDANADCVDDRLKIPLDLLAATDGLVVAVEQHWQPDSEYRGGNYAWIYDYANEGLWYYAHASKIYVQPGDVVKAGEAIGVTGRTGFNAAKLRSETHLHLMFLKIGADNLPKPIDTYQWLKKAKTLSAGNPKIKEIESFSRFWFGLIEERIHKKNAGLSTAQPVMLLMDYHVPVMNFKKKK